MRFIACRNAQDYDYVVIGAGSAGSVMAATLAENPSDRILVIEAGGTDRRIGMTMPAAMGLPLLSDKTNWKMFSDQGDREPVYLPRGRAMGGSSSVNGMNWMRGNSEDYDSWAQYGVSGWSFADVLPFFRKAETFEGGADTWRGGQGPIQVKRAPCDNALFQAFLTAGQQAGHAFNADQNGEHQAGMHRIQRNIGGGRRMNTAHAYLRRANPANVDVLTHSHVTRLVFVGGGAA